MSLLGIIWSLCLCLFICDVRGQLQQELGPEHGYVRLEAGGYTGILVAVDPAVSFDANIYNNLYNYMKNASAALYKATSKVSPLHFNDVTILLPQSWPKMPYCEKVTSEIQNEASFIVGPDTEQWGSSPHTVRLSSQCGDPGLVTVLPESFVKDYSIARRYGDNVGETILHEWAHLRYGVFDENTEESGGRSCLWFEGGATYPIKCSSNITGQTRLLPGGQGCEFIPDDNQPGFVKASLMYQPHIKAITEFCDNEGPNGILHNGEVPNPQNDRCDGRSVWEVLREHPDFRNNPRRKKRQNGVNPSDVTVRCVQSLDMERIVLTMDVSSSMKSRNRLLYMQQDVRLFLTSIPCRDTAVGMVEFSATNTDRLLHHVVPINTPANLQSLTSQIPTRTINRTCIGCGIRKALQALRMSGMSTQGAIIVVFTDGLENDRPKVKDVTDEVMRSGAVVYAILLQSSASGNHPLIKLAQRTGGTVCMFQDSRARASYYDCLDGILQHRSPNNAPIQIIQTMVSTPAGQHNVGTILVDPPLVENTLVSATWDDANSNACNNIDVTLVSPRDELIGPDDPARYMRNTALKSITINVSGFQAGTWTYIINNKHRRATCTVRLLIEGRVRLATCVNITASPPSHIPIVIRPQVDEQIQLNASTSSEKNAVKLYARLFKGQTPVVNALVTADIEDTQSNRKWSLPLWDNGAGADFKGQDGIYSRYFIGYSQEQGYSSYNVKFDVKWQQSTRLQLSSHSIGANAPIMHKYKDAPRTKFESTEPFQRSTSGKYISIYPSNDRRTVKFAPAKIADLRASLFSRREMQLQLNWIALGKELDSGTAFRYHVRVSTSANLLRHDFESGYSIQDNFLTVGSLMHPKAAGQPENIVISFMDHPDITNDTTYYIGVKSVNNEGLQSPVSNIQMFTFVFVPWTQPAVGEPEDGLPPWIWYLVAALLALLLFILLIIAIVFIRRRKSKDNTSKEKDLEATDIENMKSFGAENIYENDPEYVNIGNASKTNANEKRVEAKLNAADSSKVTSNASKANKPPDLLNEITEAKSKLKQQKRFKKKDDGVYTLSPAMKLKASAANRKADNVPKRKSIFKSIRDSGSGFFKRQKGANAKTKRETIIKPWNSPEEPLQNHSYSNPLFGESAIIPEVSVRNSIIKEK